MNDPLAKDIATEAYVDVEDLILKVVFKFQRRFGGDTDDLISRADLAFVEAVNDPNFDETKSQFPTYVWNKVWFALLEDLRTKIARNNRLPRVQLDLDSYSVKVIPEFDLDEYAARKKLSPESKQVIRELLDESIDLKLAIRSRGPETPYNVRRGLKEYLQDLGWTLRQISDSFNEIARSL